MPSDCAEATRIQNWSSRTLDRAHAGTPLSPNSFPIDNFRCSNVDRLVTSMSSHPTEAPDALALEHRSIDYVPAEERHGKVWHQGPFWFTGNFVLLTLFVGFTGPSLGLSSSWTILAIVGGVAFGTFFMAFHANQGPHMGLPQMIQSRAQFGSRGAIVPFAAAAFVYIGFNVFCVLTVSDAIQSLIGGSELLWGTLLVILSVLLALVGYDLLQHVQRWLTYVLVVVFTILTVLLSTNFQDQTADTTGWSMSAFLIQFGVAAGYNISYSVYVSDHSRYLPESAAGARLVSWTYGGAAISGAWLMSVGALLAARLPYAGPVDALRIVGDSLFVGFGIIAVITALIAQTTIIGVNLYGASLTTITGLDAFRPVKPGLGVRAKALVVLGVIVLGIALWLPDNLVASYSAFVTLLLYALVPWTAINLVDFYLVRRGRYAIDDICSPDGGVYGRWSTRALVSYAAGMLCMVPFFSLSFYTGPIAQRLDGADLAFVVGLAVSAGLYYALARHIDVDAELAVAHAPGLAEAVDT